MAGIAAATANGWLDSLTAIYGRLHTGDPGAAGTANGSSEATRKAMTFAAAADGARAQTGTASWAGWSAGSQTITHVSYWSAATAGTFLGSFQLIPVEGKPVTNGDTFKLSGCTISVAPLAA